MPRIEPTARIANGGAMRAAASISIAPAPNISASRSETCSLHSPEAHSDQLRPSEDLFLFSYIVVLRSVALDRSTPGPPKSARYAAEVELTPVVPIVPRSTVSPHVPRDRRHLRTAPFARTGSEVPGWHHGARRPTYAPLGIRRWARSFPGMNGCVLRTARSIAVVLGLGLSLSAAGSVAGSAMAADLAPHRALYTLSLERNDGGSGVTGASGTMAYELGETCDAWPVEQRYRLKMGYSESPDVTIASSLE